MTVVFVAPADPSVGVSRGNAEPERGSSALQKGGVSPGGAGAGEAHWRAPKYSWGVYPLRTHGGASEAAWQQAAS